MNSFHTICDALLFFVPHGRFARPIYGALSDLGRYSGHLQRRRKTSRKFLEKSHWEI